MDIFKTFAEEIPEQGRQLRLKGSRTGWGEINEYGDLEIYGGDTIEAGELPYECYIMWKYV